MSASVRPAASRDAGKNNRRILAHLGQILDQQAAIQNKSKTFGVVKSPILWIYPSLKVKLAPKIFDLVTTKM
jgi:hypothetical protein